MLLLDMFDMLDMLNSFSNISQAGDLKNGHMAL